MSAPEGLVVSEAAPSRRGEAADPSASARTPARTRTGNGGGRQRGSDRLHRLIPYGIVAVICYVPMLLTKPGVVSDDTKTYLYLDPGTLLRQAPSMWNPSVALGTVTHQNIGYLLPMGPFYWVLASLHVPIWVAQRLWMGSILFCAAAGVLFLCSVVGIRGSGRVVAGLAYGLSPYVMQYAGRISVILLPFSGLGWMIALTILAIRRGGWRYPALFALVVALVSGINASSILYVGIAPVLYVPYAVFVSREATGRQAWAFLVKAGVLTLLASLWWIVGLSIEGMYGVDILKYTESVEAASSAAGASEVIRGLGYWYFYNGDRMGVWTYASVDYTTRSWLLALSYAVPIGGIVSGALVRWRERAYFVVLILVGLVLSVGPHPFESPTPVGRLIKAFMMDTTFGNALRSTDRATPLVVLGLAVLLGAGISALTARIERHHLSLSLLAGVVVLAASEPLLAGGTVIQQFSQPSRPPSYILATARYLDSVHPGTRVYALPGDNFAAYRWGDTIDPVWAGVLKRPFVTHEQFIQGSIQTANLLYAIDNPLQQGTMDWNALAPIARLMSAGDVLVEYDEQYERYNAPRPALVHQQLASIPPGLGAPKAFGAPFRNIPKLDMYDETYFDLPPGIPSLPPVEVYPVRDPRPIVRAESLAAPLVIAGDNAGVVGAADVGLLKGDPTILFAGTLDTDRTLAAEVLGGHPDLVLTDTNRKQAYEWNSLSENTGYTETASEQPNGFVVNDPGFDMFPGAPASSLTTSVLPGVKSVTASSYGTSFTLRSEFRPAAAIDGDVHTAWETQGTVDQPIVAQWWQMTMKHPVSADSVTLTQPIPSVNEPWLTNQYITRATLTFDGGHPVTVNLGPESRSPRGEVVAFPRRRFDTLRIKIDATNLSHLFPTPVGSSLVGLASVGVGNLTTAQVIALPMDLLSKAGSGSLRDRLTLVMTRDRVASVPPRSSPEVAVVRQFTLPTARTFSFLGTARLSDALPDDVIDRLVGRTNPVVLSATSSSRMPGSVAETASATLDGNPRTVWMPGLGIDANAGSWLDYRFRHPVTLSSLSMEVASDAEHSRPTSVLVSAGGVTRRVSLPPIPVTSAPGSLTLVHLHFAPLTGDGLRLTFPTIDQRTTDSYETSLTTTLPIGIAQVSVPGVPNDHLPARIPTVCRDDLLRVDGQAVPVSISGSAAAALDGNGLAVSECAQSGAGVHLGAGTHLVQAADGAVTGFDIDQLAFDSAPGGGAMPLPGSGFLQAAPSGGTSGPGAAPTGVPRVSVLSQSSTHLELRVSGVSPGSKPFALVLGQSLNKGWKAAVSSGPALGSPVLVDGFADGWIVNPSALGSSAEHGTFDVTLTFAPQKEVDVALLVSALAIAGCLVIVLASVVVARRRRRTTGDAAADGGESGSGAEAGVEPGVEPGVEAEAPQLVWLRELAPFDAGLAVAVLWAVAGALAGYLVGGPWVGLSVAAGLGVATYFARGREWLRAVAATAMGGAGVAVVIHEHFGRIGAGGGWPSFFGIESTFVWIAVCLLAADAVLDMAVAAAAARANGGRRRGAERVPSPEEGDG